MRKRITYRFTQEERDVQFRNDRYFLERQEEEASITQAVKDFKLDTMSRDMLERYAARWLSENQLLQIQFDQSLGQSKKTVLDLLKLSNGSKPKTLERGVVRTASMITPYKAGKRSREVNTEQHLRAEIINLANQAIKDGTLTHKGNWIDKILEDPKYKGLSYATLYREITLK